MIQKISFKHYKLFKEKEEIELKPITLLIGKNNSGKSAVAKLPALIAGSLEGSSNPPFLLENQQVRFGYSYEDIFYGRNMLQEQLEFGMQDKNEILNVSISGDRTYNVRLSHYNHNGKSIDVVKNKFNGFSTDASPLQSLSLPFDHIESFRKFPLPTFSDIFATYDRVGSSGENAYKLLAQYYETKNELLDSIGQWFAINFEGWKLAVKDISGTSKSYEVVLENGLVKPVNIVNTGSGIRQSLPLIVRSFMPVEDDILIVMEEPETHLHPGAHGNLAERFIRSYLEDKRRHYLIETHSENFILRIQRLIAEKVIKHDDVAIYYVDYKEKDGFSKLVKIAVDDRGEIGDWPDNVFNESLDEVLKFRKAQATQENAGSNS